MKLGIDLGGSHVGIGVINENGKVIEEIKDEEIKKQVMLEKDFSEGKIIEKREKRITSEEKKITNYMEHLVEKFIIEHVQEFQKKYEITEIGIAAPGTIENNMIKKSVNLGIENYDIIKNIKQEINLPIKIKNDAKCAALAENKYGVLKPYKRGVFLTLGTGIGGAVIINNKLLDTGNLPGCEFGHIIIQKDGILCTCGKKGCFERYASMKAFKNKLRKTIGVGDEISGEQLLEIIKANDKNDKQTKEKIEKVIEEYIENLGIGISNLINIFEPEAIGIGGSFVFFKDIFLEKLKQYIQKENLIFNQRKELIIETATLGNDAGIIGSILD